MTPGLRLHRLARRFCGDVVGARVFEPLIADLQREWSDASSGAHRARVLFAGYAAFWQTFAVCGVSAVAAEATRLPAREVRSTALSALTFSTIAIILMQSFGVLVEPEGAAGQWPVVFWWMVFNTATSTLPLALLPVCLRARAHKARAADAIKIAAAGALLTVVLGGWVAPWAQRQQIAAVSAHQAQVDRVTATRANHYRYAWASVPSSQRDAPVLPAVIAASAVLALSVAWLGWTLAGPREVGLAKLAGCWAVVFFLLNVHGESEPAFAIWKRAMIFVMLTVLLKLEHRRVAAA